MVTTQGKILQLMLILFTEEFRGLLQLRREQSALGVSIAFYADDVVAGNPSEAETHNFLPEAM